MATEPITKKGTRDEWGRYTSGPGRTRGSRNQVHLDLAEIRQRIVDSWKSCNGNQLLKTVAAEKPLEYLKLIASLLPKMVEGDTTGTQIIIVVRSDAGMAFAETLQRQAQRLPALEAPHVVDALRSTPVDLDFNGVNDGNGDNGDNGSEASDGPTSEYGCAT